MVEYQFPSSKIPLNALKETVLCAVLQLLALIAVILRIWSRCIKKKRLAFNDYSVLVALLLCTGLLAIAFTSTFWSGKGFHTYEVAPAYRSRIFITFTAGIPTWAAANTAVKFSILHLYLTLFPDVWFRRVCYGTMVLSFCYFVPAFFGSFLICKPVRFNWDKTIPGTCDKHAMQIYLGHGVVNLLIDVFIVVLPMPLLWKLQLPKAKKFAVIGMFGLGTVICVVSLLRVIYIARMNMLDFHFTYTYLGMWSIVESQLGVVNACLPVMRPVLSRFFNTSLCRSVLRSSHRGESSQKPSFRPPINTDSNHSKRSEDPTDKMYPLDTLHLTRTQNDSVADSAVDLEKGR